jgi:peroxiredoxin
MWGRAIKSLFKHGFGRIRGDAMQLPGSFVIDRSGVIRFANRSRQSADWATVDDLLQAVKSLA